MIQITKLKSVWNIKLMGILNVTPDSFSDGGKFVDPAAASARAQEMEREGADIIDVGGESTGPGSAPVPLQEELRRVLPVIRNIQAMRKKRGLKFQISIDTSKAEVARQAIDAGAGMVNDVTALRGDSEMARVVAQAGVPVVLMYAKDPTPRTTREKKQYDDVVATILDFLEARIAYAVQQGIARSQIIIDPGMGAFVSGEPKYSYEILRRLGEFKKLGCPILVGTSRKSFLPGTMEERLEPTLTTHLLAIQNGADIIRVHDVAAHKRMVDTLRLARPNPLNSTLAEARHGAEASSVRRFP